MADISRSKQQIVWGPRILHTLELVMSVAAGRVVRFSLLAASVVAVGSLLYINITQPLQQSVGLPAGVTDRDPELAGNLLDDILVEQGVRTDVRPRSFTAYDRFFIISPPVISPVPPPVVP